MEIIEQLKLILEKYPFEIKTKWGGPVYTYQGKNVLGIAAFKSYTGIWFYQGALIQDTEKLLVIAQEGRTKAMRQWRFQSVEELTLHLENIHLYIQEAIQLVIDGKEIKADRNKPLPEIDSLILNAFKNNEKFKNQFETLSLSKKRDYLEYIDSAKRVETKQKRVEKIIPLIEAGVGLHDKYK
jgi:uncharacterized protein YdeI (YjbR/CyaY-like superfamily)